MDPATRDGPLQSVARPSRRISARARIALQSPAIGSEQRSQRIRKRGGKRMLGAASLIPGAMETCVKAAPFRMPKINEKSPDVLFSFKAAVRDSLTLSCAGKKKKFV